MKSPINYNRVSLSIVGSILTGLLWSAGAQALPTYARQTGQACSACHNGNFLAINAFGR